MQRGRLHNLVVLLYPMSLSEDEEFFLKSDFFLKFGGLPSDRRCEGFVDRQPNFQRGA